MRANAMTCKSDMLPASDPSEWFEIGQSNWFQSERKNALVQLSYTGLCRGQVLNEK
jgi:hypothetical protein